MSFENSTKWIFAAIWDAIPEKYVVNAEAKDRVIKTFVFFANLSEKPENKAMDLEFKVCASPADGRGVIRITIDAIDLYKPEMIYDFANTLKNADVIEFSAKKEFVQLDLCFNDLYLPEVN